MKNTFLSLAKSRDTTVHKTILSFNNSDPNKAEWTKISFPYNAPADIVSYDANCPTSSKNSFTWNTEFTLQTA